MTLTTVGYGDIVPKTTAGRFDGVMIMITGISVLGLLAGSMASFFRLDSGAPSAGSTNEPSPETAGDAVAAEVAALRTQIARLADEVARLGPSPDATRDGEP